MKKTILAAGLAVLAGCATQPKDIPAAHVSPLVYKDYDCDQISQEMRRVSLRTNELYTSLKNEADSDAAQMGVGAIIFWPALFFLEGGDGPEAQEYARLKGEHNALEEAAIQKRCAIPEDATVAESS